MDAIGPVPVAAMLLAEMGADIIRIARRPHADAAWDDVGGAVLHRSRPYLFLDLKQEADRAKALDLITSADAVIEGFRPGVMERLGLGPDSCFARKPGLVYVRMTGWGQTGPLAARAGHDINYIAVTGVLRAMGLPGEPPPVPLNIVGDYGGGAMFAVTGMLAALMCARANGTGQVVDVAMTDGVAALSSFFHGFRATGKWKDARGSNLLDGSAPFYRCYVCADGEYVAVGALEPQFFALLLDGLGIERDRFRQYNQSCWPEMEASFAARFARLPRDTWAARFVDSDACVSPVLSFAEAADFPHNRARESIVDQAGITQPAPAPRFARTPAKIKDAVVESDFKALLARWHERP